MDTGFGKWFAVCALIFLLSAAYSCNAHAGQAWYLVDSQFSGRMWYCTYQLAGTDIQTTIESPSPCAPSIYR